MTSPSLKNHPTTAPPRATRSNRLSLWKKCLAGALCLFVAGTIPANDREVGKPLDRLKQRSARQRWRELRGEWQPAPDAAPLPEANDLPKPVHAPFAPSAPARTTPLPAVEHPTVSGPAPGQLPPEQPPVVSPVPAPLELDPEVDHHALARPGAKPPTDPQEPMRHEGSFGEVTLEGRVATPRERSTIPLPHWPFEDDLDLVPESPEEDESRGLNTADASAPVIAPPPSAPFQSGTPAAESLPSPRGLPEQLPPSFPIQVAEAPSVNSVPGASPPDPPAAESPPRPIAEAKTPEPDPLQKLRSIKDIQPFYDYVPDGGDPNETHCPRPAGADPNKKYKQCPVESGLVQQGSLDRNGAIIPVYWQASNVYHNPLYFEDPGLERNGHSFSDAVQPFVSVGRFGTQVLALPYTIALDPMWKRETPLGHFRPGECAPQRHYALPINGRAAVTAAAAYTGIIYLIP